jgi:hypothetical protein
MIRLLIPLAAVLAVIFWLAHAATGAIICALAAGYLASLVIAPNRRCISCHGSKMHGNAIGSGRNLRKCWTCGGRGHYPRIGTLLLRPGISKKIKAGQHGRNW